ncbi:MAG TPA: ABC transporter substrate-binding protein [Thermodesulfobacteriota bacterium]|nr:ABC transporter substrate-binding protein [Thermodesulfobacteriota bacterium]
MKRFLCLLFLGLFILWVTTPYARAQDKVAVGIPLAITGIHAKFGEQHHNGYKLALEEILTQGGIRKGVLKGKKLEFLFEDDEGKPEKAKAVTEKLITRDNLPMIMGGYASSEVFAIAGTTAQYSIPFLSPSGAADEITQKGWKNVFRLNQPASEYCSGLQDFMLKIVKPTSMVILFENTLFGTSTAKAMKEWCGENKIKVMMFEPYEAGTPDFKPLLTLAKAAQADVIFMVSYIMDAVLLTRQTAELDIDSKLFCGGAAGFALPEFLNGVGKLGEGVMTAVLWSHDVKYPGAQKFYETFLKKYNLAPTYHGAEAYSAAYVCRDVLERTKSLSKEDLIKALSETNMMTIFGPVKFVNYKKFINQNKVPSLVVQVIKMKHETIWPPEAAATKYLYPQPKWKDKR